MAKKQEENIKLNNALAEIEKKFGKGSIITLNSNEKVEVNAISTGITSLDKALGVGGVPRGRIVEIMGPESVGKSTLTLNIIREAQKEKIKCAYIDAEHAFDIVYAEDNGVDVNSLLFSQPMTGEEALDITETLVDSEEVGLIIIDSVAALTPKAEIEGDMGQSHMGLQARLMSQALRKLTGKLNKTNTCIIFINQLRCLNKNTLINNNNTIEIIDHVVVGDNINNIRVINTYKSKEVEGLRLYPKYRPIFEISNNHLQPIISDGVFKEKQAIEIKTGDFLIQPIFKPILFKKEYIKLDDIVLQIEKESYFNCFKYKLPTVLNEDLAFILGCYYSDGSIIINKKTKVISWTEKNKERNYLIREALKKVFPDFKKESTGVNIVLGGTYYVEFFKKIGLKQYGYNKVIPELILKSSFSVIKSFLRGVFFDSHGFSSNGFIFTNENNESLIQISTLLYYFGIFSDIRKPRLNSKTNYLYFTGEDAIKFKDLIGFVENSKYQKTEKFKRSINSRGKYDVVPHKYGKYIISILKNKKQKNISGFYKYNNFNMCLHKELNFCRKTLIEFLDYMEDTEFKSFLQNNRFSEIKKIDKNIVFDAVDIEVNSANKCFVASQYLTHNSKIGVMFGNPETTTGGNALKFYSSIRIDLRRIETLKEKDVPIGSIIRAKIIKNKVAAPFKTAEFEIYYGSGICKVSDLINLAIEEGVIKKSGAWFSFEGENIAQGKENLRMLLKENKELYEKIEKQLLNKKETE